MFLLVIILLFVDKMSAKVTKNFKGPKVKACKRMTNAKYSCDNRNKDTACNLFKALPTIFPKLKLNMKKSREGVTTRAQATGGGTASAFFQGEYDGVPVMVKMTRICENVEDCYTRGVRKTDKNFKDNLEIERWMKLEQFQQEVSLMCTAHSKKLHPRVYESSIFQVNGALYGMVIMEKLPMDLWTYLAQNLDRESRYQMALKTFSILKKIISKLKLYHHDLHLGNILVDSKANPVPIDFGDAQKSRSKAAELTKTTYYLVTDMAECPTPNLMNAVNEDRGLSEAELQLTLVNAFTKCKVRSNPGWKR